MRQRWPLDRPCCQAPRSSGPFAIEIPALTRGRSDPRAAVETIFGILAHGWTDAGNAAPDGDG
jgi:hypothetical protein